MKFLIGINNLSTIDQYVYANHIQLFFRLGRNTEHEFMLCNPRRMSIDRMRNEAAKIAMDTEADYLVFMDDDVLVPFDAIQQLLKYVDICDVIAGVTHIRGYPFEPMIFNFTNDEYRKNTFVTDYKEKAVSGFLLCDAVGFSLCLIKVSLLRKMRPPFFVTTPNQTEDVFFCVRAKEQIPDVRIGVNTELKTQHSLGSDFVGPDSVDLWREFTEKRYPEIAKEIAQRQDHPIEYILKEIE